VTIRYLHIIGDAIVLWTLAYFISLIFPSARLGGNYGFTRVVTTLGTSLGAFGFGQVMAHGGYSLPFYLSGIFEIAVALFLLSQWRHMTAPSMKEMPAPAVLTGIEEPE
jgi:MFS family permease